jgi:hypothetical protein
MPEPFRGLHCPHLVYLNLNGYASASSPFRSCAVWPDLHHRCRSLHVGDEGVTGIARASPMLQHLNVKVSTASAHVSLWRW